MSPRNVHPVNELGNDIAERLASIDWQRVSSDQDTQGAAMIKGLLSPSECAVVATLYPNDDFFRSRVVMERHGSGRGEYKYFSYPSPNLIARLRTATYPQLAPIANRWNATMGMTCATRRVAPA